MKPRRPRSLQTGQSNLRSPTHSSLRSPVHSPSSPAPLTSSTLSSPSRGGGLDMPAFSPAYYTQHLKKHTQHHTSAQELQTLPSLRPNNVSKPRRHTSLDDSCTPNCTRGFVEDPRSVQRVFQRVAVACSREFGSPHTLGALLKDSTARASAAASSSNDRATDDADVGSSGSSQSSGSGRALPFSDAHAALRRLNLGVTNEEITIMLSAVAAPATDKVDVSTLVQRMQHALTPYRADTSPKPARHVDAFATTLNGPLPAKRRSRRGVTAINTFEAHGESRSLPSSPTTYISANSPSFSPALDSPSNRSISQPASPLFPPSNTLHTSSLPSLSSPPCSEPVAIRDQHVFCHPIWPGPSSHMFATESVRFDRTSDEHLYHDARVRKQRQKARVIHLREHIRRIEDTARQNDEAANSLDMGHLQHKQHILEGYLSRVRQRKYDHLRMRYGSDCNDTAEPPALSVTQDHYRAPRSYASRQQTAVGLAVVADETNAMRVSTATQLSHATAPSASSTLQL